MSFSVVRPDIGAWLADIIIIIIIIIIAPCLTGCSVLGSAPLHEFVPKTFTSTARFLGRRPGKENRSWTTWHGLSGCLEELPVGWRKIQHDDYDDDDDDDDGDDDDKDDDE